MLGFRSRDDEYYDRLNNSTSSNSEIDVPEELFKLMTKSDLRLSLILSFLGIDTTSEFWDLIRSIKASGFYSGSDGEIGSLFEILGYRVTEHNSKCKLQELSIAERLESLIDNSEADYIVDIKLAAFIEGNMEVFNSIGYDRIEDRFYSIQELEAICSKLNYIEYRNFELVLRK